MRNLNAFAKKHGGSRIWEVESVESYLGSEDVRDVMCMDAHCWSARGEKDKMCHPMGMQSSRRARLVEDPCGASGQDRPNQRILLSRPVWLVQPVLGKTIAILK